MSTNSATLFSVEDDGSLLETPIPSQQKCTRGSPCSKSDCLVCNGPVSNHHVCNLTGDLEDSSPHSKSNKPTTPAAHWINNLTDAFKEPFIDHDVDELMLLNTHYFKMANEKLFSTAKQTVADYNQIQAPIQTPPPLPSPHAV